jgi:hypothetical protein
MFFEITLCCFCASVIYCYAPHFSWAIVSLIIFGLTLYLPLASVCALTFMLCALFASFKILCDRLDKYVKDSSSLLSTVQNEIEKQEDP